MPSGRWKVAFAVVVEPFSKQPCLVLSAAPVEHAVYPERYRPVNVRILGIGQDGKHYNFVYPMQDFEQAMRCPVTLLEADGIMAPTAKVQEAALITRS